MIPAIALIIGLAIGLILDPSVPVWMQPYLPIAVIAALDAVFGALRAVLDGIFDDKVFVVSFLSNVVVAAFIGAQANHLFSVGSLAAVHASTAAASVAGLAEYEGTDAASAATLRSVL